MKKAIYTLLFLTISVHLFAQWTDKSFTFDGKLREYRVYVPTNYNAAKPASIVVTLHGLGDDMTNFSGIGMDYIADTANILVLVPQALPDILFGNAWNSGAGLGYYPNSNVNDIGFLNAMLDSTILQYAVNQQRIYMCGFSMGGFMTEKMACQSNGRFAAFASVSGTIGSALTQCNPGRTVPIAHFHGTADGTVGYANNTFGIGADSVVNFWVQNNQCNPTPIHNTFPDIAADSLTVEHFAYSNGFNMNADVEFFKVNNGDHTWLFSPQNDIDYTAEIWKFFNKHINIQTTAITPKNLQNEWSVAPNPTSDKLLITLASSAKNKLQLSDIQGNIIFYKEVYGDKLEISLKEYGISQGIYVLKLNEKCAKIVLTN